MIEISVRRQRQNFRLDVSLTLGQGITALFGPSGVGKSSLLNLIAGLDKPASGHIRISGETLYDSKTGIDLAVHKRRIGYVFQDALLLPHLSVQQNLLYGFRQGGPQLANTAEFLGLTGLMARRPATLSGGERQRVAIGRALLSSPRLLLMDEPLSNLDMDRKREIFPYIEQLQDRFGIPVILVSHAAEEVARLANHVVMMRDGRVTSEGQPQSVFSLPENHASRFERLSILTATYKMYDAEYDLTTLAHPAGNISLAGHLKPAMTPTRIVVRATDVTLALSPPKDISARTMLKGAVSGYELGQGPIVITHVKLLGGEELAVALTRKARDEMGLGEGNAVWCLLKSVSIDERWIASS